MADELKGADRERAEFLPRSMGLNGLRSSQSPVYLARPGWLGLPVPRGAALDAESFAAVAAVAAHCADDQCLVANTFSPHPNSRVVACAPVYEDFRRALRCDADFTTYDAAVVGPSGRWLLILRGLHSGVLLVPEDFTLSRRPPVALQADTGG